MQNNPRLFSGFCGSLLLHGGLAAWLLLPSQTITIMPEQRIIEVSIIMESPAQENHKAREALKEETSNAPEKPIIEPTDSHAEIARKEQPSQNQLKQLSHHSQEAQKSEPDDHPTHDAEAKANSATGTRFVDAVAISTAIMPPVFNAAYLDNAPPEYPPAARRRNITGKVVLQVEVSEGGVAQSVIILKSSGSDMLDESARKAVTTWHFVPAKRGNEAVSASVAVPIVFALN